MKANHIALIEEHNRYNFDNNAHKGSGMLDEKLDRKTIINILGQAFRSSKNDNNKQIKIKSNSNTQAKNGENIKISSKSKSDNYDLKTISNSGSFASSKNMPNNQKQTNDVVKRFNQETDEKAIECKKRTIAKSQKISHI